MTARVLATVVVVVVLVGVVVAGYVTSRRRAKGVVPGAPDKISGEVVSGLMTELRKAEAEAAYWRSTAERLQREADDR